MQQNQGCLGTSIEMLLLSFLHACIMIRWAHEILGALRQRRHAGAAQQSQTTECSQSLESFTRHFKA